jgi:hypothetical protein
VLSIGKTKLLLFLMFYLFRKIHCHTWPGLETVLIPPAAMRVVHCLLPFDSGNRKITIHS